MNLTDSQQHAVATSIVWLKVESTIAVIACTENARKSPKKVERKNRKEKIWFRSGLNALESAKWSQENVSQLFCAVFISSVVLHFNSFWKYGKIAADHREQRVRTAERCNKICGWFWLCSSMSIRMDESNTEQEGKSGKIYSIRQHEASEQASHVAWHQPSVHRISCVNKITETNLHRCKMHNGFENACSICCRHFSVAENYISMLRHKSFSSHQIWHVSIRFSSLFSIRSLHTTQQRKI